MNETDQYYNCHISSNVNQSSNETINLILPNNVDGHLHITGINLSVEVESNVKFIMNLNSKYGDNSSYSCSIPVAFNQVIPLSNGRTVYICTSTVDVYQKLNRVDDGKKPLNLTFEMLTSFDSSKKIIIKGAAIGATIFRPLILR